MSTTRGTVYAVEFARQTESTKGRVRRIAMEVDLEAEDKKSMQ
jgi:hypothetical protein